jgi:hypothetical protein
MGGTVKNVLRCSFLAALALLFGSGHAFATAINDAPPTGAILDLDGTAIPHSYQQYTVDFQATATTTNLSFALREDPAFLFLDDVTMGQCATSACSSVGSNLVLNGGFESGPLGANAPADWTYLNTFGATFAGVVENNGPHTGSNNYYDGAVQAYDGITQAIGTTIGDFYSVSFWLNDNSEDSTFSRLSTNGDITDTGGNGIDLLVYAGAIPTINPVPEPATLTMFGLGLAAMYRRRRAQKAV